MKRLSKLFSYTVIAIFIGTLFSCSNLLEQNPNELQENLQEGTAYLKVSVGSKTSRTVMSGADEANFTNLVLKGTKSGGSEETLGSWENLSAMQNAAIPVTSGSWTFTLTAKNGGTSLSGSLQKEITLGENSLSFNLSISDIGNGDGSFSITLNFAEAENAGRVTKVLATLENIDGTAVAGLNGQLLTPSENAVTFSASGIAAGTYRAKVVFYATEGGTDFELATYRELVQISSGLASTATRAIESFDSLYTITYNLNGGTLAEGSVLQESVTRKSEAITLPSLTRDYYTFDGWYTTDNFADGTQVTRLSNFTDNVSVYAKFTPVTFTITYVLNGGTNAEGAVVSYTVEDDVTLPIPEKGEELFGGLYYDSNFSGSPATGWNAGDKCENITLYAKWDGIKVTAENIVEKIKVMTQSGTLKASGEFNSTVISNINEALKTLAGTNPEILVTLDLSEVTGLVELQLKAFEKCSNLEGIVLPETLETIGYSAFDDCTSLKRIKIPDSVTTIYAAFYGCNSLEEITIPFVGESLNSETYKTVFGSIFWYNYEKGKIRQYYSDSEYMKYYIPSSLKKVTVTGGKLPARAFNGCSMLEEIVIEKLDDGIVEKKVFSGCTKLKEVILPLTVTSIGEQAFSNCESLESITLPENLSEIGNGAFESCSKLKYIEFPDRLTNIGEMAFRSCKELESIELPDGLKKIGKRAFSGSGLKNLYVPDSVIEIDSGIVSGCTSLEEINLPFLGPKRNPDSMPDTSETVFGYCFGSTMTGSTIVTEKSGYTTQHYLPKKGSWTESYIPNSIKKVTIRGGQLYYNSTGCVAAFVDCKLIEEIVLENIESIPQELFKNCQNLKTVTFGEEVTSMGASIFKGCTNLKNITIPGSITKLNGSTLSYSSLENVTIQEGVEELGNAAFSGLTELKTVSFPKSLKKIGMHAFNRCSSLESVSFAYKKTWYKTKVFNYTNGSPIGNMSNPEQNAANFKDAYLEYNLYSNN